MAGFFIVLPAVGIALVMLICGIAFAVLLFSVLAVGFGRYANKHENKKRRASVACMVLACCFNIWFLRIVVPLVFPLLYTEIQMPDGDTAYVSATLTRKVKKIASSTDDDRIDELDRLLEKHPKLVYYKECEAYSIIDLGAACGNYEVVEVAIKHGVQVDNESYNTTMELYIEELSDREVVADDAKIMGLLLDNSAKTGIYTNEKVDPYKNAYGYVAWIVLNNDDTVTDAEADLIQTMADKGCTDERIANVYKSGTESTYTYEGYHDTIGYNADVVKDENYNKVVELISG